MKTMTILGCRPELIKMSETIKKLDKHTDHTFVHTGQNYDYELDEIFYKDLNLRKPDYNLEATTVPQILEKVQIILEIEKPDAVVILKLYLCVLVGILDKVKYAGLVFHVTPSV